jgi:raffinose synthase
MPDIAPYLHAGGAKPRWQKQLPEVASYLGWCTWDAFYHDVSVQGIMSGLESFKCAGVQPRWIIIDDGWQVGVV